MNSRLPCQHILCWFTAHVADETGGVGLGIELDLVARHAPVCADGDAIAVLGKETRQARGIFRPLCRCGRVMARLRLCFLGDVQLGALSVESPCTRRLFHEQRRLGQCDVELIGGDVDRLFAVRAEARA